MQFSEWQRPSKCRVPLSFFCASLFLSLDPAVTDAAPLTSATVTETKNTVRYKPPTAEERPAQVADVVQGADVLRTGERSLAEIEFQDKTVTRLGSRSVFSFSGKDREFHVGKGLTLICVPKGTGGGRIVTSAITAAIEGTTVLTEGIELPAKTEGGPPRRAAKLIFMEGRGRLSIRAGRQSGGMEGGQMILQFEDSPKLADVFYVDLKTLENESEILNGFKRRLPTQDGIQEVIKRQQAELARNILTLDRFYIGGRGARLRQWPPAARKEPLALNDPAYRDEGIDGILKPCQSQVVGQPKDRPFCFPIK